LCAFDYLMCIAVILIVILQLMFAWYIHNKLPPDTQFEERDRIFDVDVRSQMLLSNHLYKQKCFKPQPYLIRLFMSN
jgi:hypothetical protein